MRRTVPWLLVNTVAALVGTIACAQDVTAKAPAGGEDGATVAAEALPDAPGAENLPVATPLPPKTPPDRAVIESDNPQSRHDDVYFASGNVVVTYQDHVLRADSVEYNDATGEITFDGHARLSGGENDEFIEASHGSYNIRSGTGVFYDVHGSVQMDQRMAHGASPKATAAASATGAIVGTPVGPSSRETYATTNPFLFEGKKVLKTGPKDYVVYDGSVTSCLLPKPDWEIASSKIELDGRKAHATGSTFRLLGIPILFLPYVTHPVDVQERQSGILIPEISLSKSTGSSTGSKGLTIGEQGYLTLGRSADLTLGLLYYSERGFSENGTFRYRGPGNDFLTAHFSALQDRGFHYQAATANGRGVITLYTNQGGQDVTAAFRHDFNPTTRLVGDAEYLSSYVYREVFTENFNQAVSSDIDSDVFVTHEASGYAWDARVERYEGLKVVPTDRTSGEIAKIWHAPSLDFTAVDHRIPQTPLLWSLQSSVAGLKRVQPNFVSSGIIERFDLKPELTLPLHFSGWNIAASVASQETVYSRSRKAPYKANNLLPVELQDPVNRADVEFQVDLRPPVIERDFAVPKKLQGLFGDEVRHTVEPEFVYRDVKGVGNFLSILRFDDTDLVSDTNEIQYGLTQHLYFRPHAKAVKPPKGCPAQGQAKPASGDNEEAETLPPETQENPDQQPSLDAHGIPNAAATAPDIPTRTHARRMSACDQPQPAAPQQELFSWQLKQKYFFDPTFGHAVIEAALINGVLQGTRNIFETTLNLSGVSFLTEPRNISPLVSRMRLRTSGHTDFEYDFDYDTGASKFTSQNVLLDVHEARYFAGFAYARLNAPGRFHTEVVNQTYNNVTGIATTQISNFNQMRVLGGFGTPTRAGLSLAGGMGVDLSQGDAQYITAQASYNWNCCGLSVEYRRYNLGTIRDEGTESFNFTLANIGSAGNMRRSQSLF